jgi:hypothetical protein
MKHAVFAVVFTDNFAAMCLDEGTVNLSRCVGVYASYVEAVAAMKKAAVASACHPELRVRKHVSKSAPGHEVYQLVYVYGGYEEVEANYHVSSHEIELDADPGTQ